jgi:hypothetical protein
MTSTDRGKRTPETYTAEEMTALLSEWARVVGSYSMYAAMHLLTCSRRCAGPGT